MGILRADRVSGLGGANAINGSVNFAGDLGTNGNYLAVSDELASKLWILSEEICRSFGFVTFNI